MKYAVLTKKIDELNVGDFDEEVLNQYKYFSVTPEGVSYTVDGQKIIKTTDELIQDMCEKQIELIFDSLAERVAKKMHKAVDQESIKFYYVESIDDYWIGQRQDNFYYAKWNSKLGFVWSVSRYLPWGEHIVDENTLWKEHTYPSEPKEIPFTEWIVGFTKKMHETVEPSQNCVKCEHYFETEDDTGVHSHCRATCSNNAQVDKLRKTAEETDDNGVRKGILKAIEVLEGDTEWSR